MTTTAADASVVSEQGGLAARWLLPPGHATPTTGAPLRVVAHLAEPVVALAEHAAPLDGPLSWGAYVAATAAGLVLPPLTRDQVVDFRLPLAVWAAPAPVGAVVDPLLLGAGGLVWGWRCSRAQYEAAEHTSVDVRRKPPTGEMGRFTGERKHHVGLGPFKARAVALPAVTARMVWWHALGDADGVRDLLTHVTHLGRHARHGHGRVLRWEVQADPDAAEGWRERPFPREGGRLEPVRAPYWHPSRLLPCA